MSKVVLAKLIKRMPEKETEYDKNIMDKEYWQYQWSDGSSGQGSLYQSQIDGLEKGDKMGKSEQVQQRVVCMLVDAGYVVDFSDAAAVLKALSEYEEKYNDMLEYILMQAPPE